MTSANHKYILYLVCFSIVPVITLAVFGTSVFTDKRPLIGSGAAIAFFFLYEIVVMRMMNPKSPAITTPGRFLNLFMGLKAVKILLSLVWITLYAVAIKVETKRFALVFAALYLIYLLFETLYLTRNRK